MVKFAHRGTIQGLDGHPRYEGSLMTGNRFYGLYRSLRFKPLTVVPASIFRYDCVMSYFIDRGYTFKVLSNGELVDTMIEIEVGIGCFAYDGANIVLDEERRDDARMELEQLAKAVGMGFDTLEPIEIIIRNNDN